MKRILITGANSYVGTSFEKWLKRYSDKYYTYTIDVKNEAWREIDFSGFDTLLHVAGIAHIKETKENEELYYKVNCDLAFEVAKKAKEDGIKQFILLSSMSVYGVIEGTIDSNTLLNPRSYYGKSKLKAENIIKPLEDKNFNIAVLRPPMIYGYGCKGNYPKLANLVLKTPIFPNINNKRSMIYVDNLCEFLRLIIDNNYFGLYFPQNAKYVNTSDLARLINKAHGKNIVLIKLFNPILYFIKKRSDIVSKIFGNLVYDESLNVKEFDYCIFSFEQSIGITEKMFSNK